MVETYEVGAHVIAAVQHMVKALKATNNLNDDTRNMLSDLETHLAALAVVAPSEAREFVDIKDRLKHGQERIMSWVSNQSMLWDAGTEIATEYVEAVEEVCSLLDDFRSLSLEGNVRHKEIIHQTENVLQIAMARLEDEAKYILVQGSQSFVPDTSLRSYEENGADEGSVVPAEESIVLAEDDSFEVSAPRTNSRNESKQYAACLVNPDAIHLLKSIANVMFAANYDQEFCEAFVRTQKEVLDEYLIALGMEKLSIEELLKMDWVNLESKIKRWTRVVKTFVRVYLAGEKLLCAQIFADLGSYISFCFVNATKSSMACLLNFGEAITLGPHRPEKLFCLLNSYEVLADLCVEINALFPEDVGLLVREEFHKLIGRFGDSARGTFLEFGDFILCNPSKDPVPGGGLHPLTRYVMNYIRTILEYNNTLNFLLQDHSPAAASQTVEEGFEESTTPHTCRLVALHLRSIAAKLESTLEKDSHLYKDGSLQHIFLMNNIHYIVKKVMDSDLRPFFGDKWIKARMTSYQQHATCYERATWSSIVAWLRDEGISGSRLEVREILKERLKGFYVAFEEACKNQRYWSIRDPQLKDELRISISLKVVLAYQGFVWRCKNNDLERHIKYEVDELEKFLSDLFEGSPRSARSFWSR